MDVMADIHPPDYATPAGQVRALIPDTELLEDPADLTADPSYILSDAIIQSYLVMSRDNVFWAASLALNAIATTEGLILKVLKSDDRQTDGAKLADALGKRAQWLRDRGDEEDSALAEEAFEIFYPEYCPDNTVWLR